MTQLEKFLKRIMDGSSDTDIPFAELCTLLNRLKFEERIRGDHHIFTRDGLEEIINLQPKGGQAKPYQVKQVRSLLRKYRLDRNRKAGEI